MKKRKHPKISTVKPPEGIILSVPGEARPKAGLAHRFDPRPNKLRTRSQVKRFAVKDSLND